MKRILITALLAATFATAADQPTDKSMLGAYGGMVLATAVPVLLGDAIRLRGAQEIGAWMMIGGAVVGPSAGQFYARSYGTGLAAGGLRVGAGFRHHSHLDPHRRRGIAAGSLGLDAILTLSGDRRVHIIDRFPFYYELLGLNFQRSECPAVRSVSARRWRPTSARSAVA